MLFADRCCVHCVWTIKLCMVFEWVLVVCVVISLVTQYVFYGGSFSVDGVVSVSAFLMCLLQ